MRKKIIVHTGGMLILGFCAGISIMIFRPQVEKLGNINIFSNSKKLSSQYLSGELSGTTPEIENVVKNEAGDIVNITLKKEPIYLPSDSLFINENDAIPLSDILVGDTIHLAKLGPKFSTLLKKESINLEVCRTTNCTNKLILKIPQSSITATGAIAGTALLQNQITNSGSTNTMQAPSTKPSLPLTQITMPFTATGKLALNLKGRMLLGTVDYTDNDDLKTLQGTIDGNYSGTLDRKRGFFPRNGILQYQDLGELEKYKKLLYVLKINGGAFLTKGDMYFLNFNGEYRGIKYSIYDNAGKKAHIFVNDKIHSLPNIFSKKEDFYITLETTGQKYTIAIYSSEGERIWMGVGIGSLGKTTPLYVGSKNGEFPFAGGIYSVNIYGE